MLAPRPLSALSLVSVLVTGTYSTAIPGTATTWNDWTCPPAETQYVPVTDTYTTAVTQIETVTITQYQTIVDTQVQTERTTEIAPTTEVLPTTIVEVDTVTQVETELQTVVTTSPVTLTATEKEQIYSSTIKLTSIKLCPTRITNPTFEVAVPLPTDWTWGCPPGWLCKPKQEGCNFEVGLPDRNFYCAPNECIPAEALSEPLTTWNTDPSGNLSAADNPALGVTPIDSYFNMNPTNFGLTYQIFVIDQVITYTSTILLPPAPSPGVRLRQAQTDVPPMCYDWCNNVAIEAQAVGKTSDLCEPTSAFERTLLSCVECIQKHPVDPVDTLKAFVEIAPQFQQFIDYCDQTVLVQGTSATIVQTSGGSSSTVVVPTTSVTIVATVEPTSAVPASTTTVVISAGSSPTTITTTPTTTPKASSTSVEASSVPITTVPVTTTATLPTILTSVVGGSTLTGSQLSQITIIMPAGANSSTTMAGPDLSGATIILAGNTTTVVTSSYVTTYTSAVVVSGESSPNASPTSFVAASQSASGTPAAPPGSTFTGAAGAINPHSAPSWLAALLSGLLVLF